MKILDGKAVSLDIKEKIKRNIDNNYLLKNKQAPTLACVIVGENPASKVYVGSKKKACNFVGFNSIIIELPEDVDYEEIYNTITMLNNDENVSGILLQLPLPNNLKIFEKDIIELIDPKKDVDGLTSANLGLLFNGNKIIAPCTASGIIDLLDYYDIDLDGKNAVVIGRSLLVGKSVAVLLEQKNATVTLCHSHTKNLNEITSKADVLIVAMGKPNAITSDMVKNGAIVVDVGINRVDGKIVGDVDFENVSAKCKYITPVPGGVGPMTIAELLKNTLKLHELQQDNKQEYTTKKREIE